MAELAVKWIKVTKIHYLSQEDQKYHKQYENAGEVVEEMQGYYPNKDVELDTKIVVIRFELADKHIRE
jgi:hypothetical protein